MNKSQNIDEIIRLAPYLEDELNKVMPIVFAAQKVVEYFNYGLKPQKKDIDVVEELEKTIKNWKGS